MGGAWERHGFAAPGIAHAAILALGSTYSRTPERSAVAVRYIVEVLRLSRHEVPLDRLLREATAQGNSLAVDRNGQQLTEVPMEDARAIATLEGLGAELEAVVLPEFLSDAFLTALVRSSVRCALVVKDATRVRVSPVYYTAWSKKGGSVAVIEPMELLAVTTNPTNPTGADSDPGEFRRMVAEAVPDVPVHDVLLEASADKERPSWKFWR